MEEWLSFLKVSASFTHVHYLPGPIGFWVWNSWFTSRVYKQPTFAHHYPGGKSGQVRWNTEKQFPFNKVKAAGSHKNYSLSLWKPVCPDSNTILLSYASDKSPMFPATPPSMAQLVVSWYTLGSFSLKLILSTRNYSGRGPIMFLSSPLVSRGWTYWGLEESIDGDFHVWWGEMIPRELNYSL